MARKTERSATATDQARWRAVQQNDLGDCEPFTYAVVTTGIYCRPECRSRLPKRSHVRFFDSARDAEREGFRPCKRCRPDEQRKAPEHLAGIRDACRLLADGTDPPGVDTLAQAAGLSAAQFRRVFKKIVGVTPRQYHAAVRRCVLQDSLRTSRSVTTAIFDAGFQSVSRVYDRADELLGMSPSAYRRGGRQQSVRYATGKCFLGRILVAVTARGVCAILFGDSVDELGEELRRRFRKADIAPDESLAEVLDIIVHFVERPALGLALPLDVQGTAFQQQVWEALQTIPAGETRSYREVAEQLGQPTASRAVAQACAANNLAVAIPCHRVVTRDGRISDYRWGVERKKSLLRRETKE
jgi:AraC family transcriptional regulator of adaptative response/methylated-DNA-[protein]-cysteine methyltransferase